MCRKQGKTTGLHVTRHTGQLRVRLTGQARGEIEVVRDKHTHSGGSETQSPPDRRQRWVEADIRGCRMPSAPLVKYLVGNNGDVHWPWGHLLGACHT